MTAITHPHLKTPEGDCQDCLVSADLDSSSLMHLLATDAQNASESHSCPPTKGQQS